MSATSTRPRTRGAAPLRVVFFTLFAVLALMAVVVGLRPTLGDPARAFQGTAYPDPEPAPEFSLLDHTGNTASLADYRGKAVLLFFGFTHCPDVCPLTLNRLSRILEGMGDRGDDARILLVTVDPGRDTPEVLASYVERFGPRVIGLTGDPIGLEEIRRAYGVYAGLGGASSAPHGAGHAPGAEAPPMLVHTTAVFGIDRAGRLRVLMHADGAEDALRSDIRALLR